MPYTDLLRLTVFLTGAEATALGAIAAIAAGRDNDTTTVDRRGGLVGGGARHRPLARPPPARRRRSPRRPGRGPHGDQPPLRAAGPDRRRAPLADRRHRPRRRRPRHLLPRRRGDRRRLRAARLARLAHPRGGRARRRAARRRQVLRRPQLGAASRSSWSAPPACAAGRPRIPRSHARLSPRRPQAVLPRAGGARAGALARARRLRPLARQPRGRRDLELLRGAADRQRPPRLPPRPLPRLQGRLPALPDDARLPRAAQGGLGLPRPAGRARGREGARHLLEAGDRGVRDRRVQRAAAASRSSSTSRSGTG